MNRKDESKEANDFDSQKDDKILRLMRRLLQNMKNRGHEKVYIHFLRCGEFA
jgi:hypothetical protein